MHSFPFAGMKLSASASRVLSGEFRVSCFISTELCSCFYMNSHDLSSASYRVFAYTLPHSHIPVPTPVGWDEELGLGEQLARRAAALMVLSLVFSFPSLTIDLT